METSDDRTEPGQAGGHEREDAPADSVMRRLLRHRAAREGWWLSKALYTAAYRFLMDDGLYMASALAFSLLLAIFPFIIFLTAITGSIGGERLAAWLTDAMFDALPNQVAEALEPEIFNVLIRDGGGGLLTFSLLVMVVSVSSAVETVRGGLNRAYGLIETRSVIHTRIESIAFVILGTVALIVVALVGVVAPIALAATTPYLPETSWLHFNFEITRHVVLAVVLAGMLFAFHRILPCHSAPLPLLWPGIVATLALWWLGGRMFSWYLGSFANYSRVYAGLAGIVAVLIFFYVAGVILLYAGALNRAIQETRGAARGAGRD